MLALPLALPACNETQILSRRGRFNPEPYPRPDRIVVYDFDIESAVVTLDPSIAKEIARGRTPIVEARRHVALAVADVLSRTLVEEILALGLPAERGAEAPVPKPGALLIDGALVRVDEGSRAKRTAIGFGAGKSELRTRVRVYRVTDRGRRRIAEFDTTTEDGEAFGKGEVVKVAGAPDAETRAANSLPADQARELPSVMADAERTGQRASEILAELFLRHGWIADHGD